MEKEHWRALQDAYPALGRRILELGMRLYEMGAVEARNSSELSELTEILAQAPEEARNRLGFDGIPFTKEDILRSIFEQGSSLLLDYVRYGSCS